MSRVRLALCLLALLPALCHAAIQARSGPYVVSMTAQPRVIPVGQARLVFQVTDSAGKPIDGLDIQAIARMPGMFMGEREQKAQPVAGVAGAYSMQAAFPMAGAYQVALNIGGEPGSATVTLPVRTGEDTGGAEPAGFSFISLIPWAIGLVLVVFIISRMRRTGQRVMWQGIVNRATISGVLLLAILLVISIYAVNNWRRQGAMTPIEAQVMEMNTPAPPGVTAVELAPIAREPIAETVAYSGQAVGFVEQDVNPRVTGVITAMSVYVGHRVKKGQVLARLDTSQLDPELAERAAMTQMATEGVGVASSEYQAALQAVAEARADAEVKESGVAEAGSMLEAARQDQAVAEAERSVAESDIASAKADVDAAQAAATYAREELGRMQRLYGQKAISRSELQEAETANADAQAKLQQARTRVNQAQAKATASQAAFRRSASMIAAADRRLKQAQAEVRAARAAILTRQKAAEAAKKGVGREQAAVAQARARYQGAAAQRGYAELKAEVDGVVTERLVSPGTLVNPGQPVLKVAQTSPIRLQANVAATDVSRIAIGNEVEIRGRNGVGSVRAKVSSIQPALDPQARTGIVEVLWNNDDGQFLPGQFVEMVIKLGSPREELTVPVEAIQKPPGDAPPFVWVATLNAEGGRYTVSRKVVQIGASDGKRTAVSGDLAPGQLVVVAGGMYLKEGGEVAASSPEVAASGGPTVEVLSGSYNPASITVESGKPTTITFIRRSEVGCGTEIVFPELGIEKPLPLNEPVKVTIAPTKPGELRFTCGMDMFNGKVIVR
ncbi:MAG: Multidrug resistance protein MdtA [Fimbriimonadaceae bacterium]|nr:Multidrug resistance protein MdtA [Fimbriimonadaceae bacterium]